MAGEAGASAETEHATAVSAVSTHTTTRYDLPTPRRTLTRLFRTWLIGITVFGYGPAITYGWLAWLLNEKQWRWAFLMYFTEVPLIGGFCILLVPWLAYRPIHRALTAWSRGESVDRSQCIRVYQRALELPWWVAVGSFIAAFIGYVVGVGVVHWQANQPISEMIKTMPAIPLVGGMMGAFCYFGTVRALHPVVAWCSVQLKQARPLRHTSLAAKFLTTTCVLAIAAVCLLQPAAYTLGQLVTEEQLQDRALTQLKAVAGRVALFERLQDRTALLRDAVLGRYGYAFILDREGHIITPHPRNFTRLEQEQLYNARAHVQGREGVWVDRVGYHRVVAFAKLVDPPWMLMSIAFPNDFAAPLNRYVRFGWVVMIEVFFVVILFGRYFTRGITTPLAELTRAARQIAERGDFSQHVPVTTTDELSEVARSFNHMVEELRTSKADLEQYTKRLEQSTQELSALNQEMEDLLRVVSHDLRAPLINIQGFSKRLEPVIQEALRKLTLVAERSQDNGLRTETETFRDTMQARFAESLRFISKGVEKMDALLASLLAISRVGRKADPIRPNDLNTILDDVLATFDHQLKERSIQVIRHPLSTQVPCRLNEINQVFSNLIANAINYMGAAEQRFIEIGGREQAEHVECYVRDTGIGIGSEDQERVFQMFTRLQAIDVPGEGVGLAYVRKILRSHGGKIWVTSQKGQGSTFFFTLPMTPATMQGVTG
ncbi:MAG: HAMP domain-containing protein [Candidatus Omnitrophica bacterium]|nr:HAMP domain-containing protein [Candidatus Omnitrophota bacterium]